MIPSTRLRLVEGPAGAPAGSTGAAQDVLLDAFDFDAALQVRFETACQQSAAALREEVLTFRAVLKERGHHYRHHDREHEETAQALYELAGELLPASPAAALARLRERVGGQGQEARSAQEAVEDLVASEHDLYDEVVLLFGRTPSRERLRTFAQRLWGELRTRGQWHEPKGFTDHVWMLLWDFFPGSPGAAWDSEWADGVYTEVLGDLARHAVAADIAYSELDTTNLEGAMNEMAAAEEARDRSAFREAGRRAIREGRRAVRAATSDAP